MVSQDNSVGYEDYNSSQIEWIKSHKFYMGLEECRDVSEIEAVFDFVYGNDHYPSGRPSERFKHHVSPRGLTWEQEYRIFYVKQKVLPSIEKGSMSSGDLDWATAKVSSLLDDGLWNLDPIIS